MLHNQHRASDEGWWGGEGGWHRSFPKASQTQKMKTWDQETLSLPKSNNNLGGSRGKRNVIQIIKSLRDSRRVYDREHLALKWQYWQEGEQEEGTWRDVSMSTKDCKTLYAKEIFNLGTIILTQREDGMRDRERVMNKHDTQQEDLCPGNV